MPTVMIIAGIAIVCIGTWAIVAIGKQADADMHEALFRKEEE